jgi:5,6-dimethylbenzimidazole synthase
MDLRTAIFSRRDTRHFAACEIPDSVVTRALEAAHAAPSVGLSQPWRFVMVRSLEVRQKVKELFEIANERAACEALQIEGEERVAVYRSLRLQGIVEAPLGMFVFCEMPPEGDFVLGTSTERETILWSSVCAVQNFWLSLVADGYGMGWVSIIDYEAIRPLLNTPAGWRPLGYFCIGKPSDDYGGQPMLVRDGWGERHAAPWVQWI